jgi:anti-sigma factor RsiW
MVTFAPAASGARSFWIASVSASGETSSRSYVQSRPAARKAADWIAGLRE